MGMPVAELQQRMSSAEFEDWIAYDQVSPIGAKRLDHLAALIAATVANSNPWRKKGSKPIPVSSFVPDWRPKPKASTPEDQLAYVTMLNALFGGSDERKKAA
jgi:hypothetical protein